MDGNRYKLSFIGAGLARRESVQIADLFLALSDWTLVRERLVEDNLLQARTLSALQRIGREILFRLQQLEAGELRLLIESSPQEQGYLLWLAICRSYRFIADFAVEVLHERYINLTPDLKQAHFDAYFNRKAEWHPELEQITSSTRLKARQILFRMLREANLLTQSYAISPVVLSHRLIEAFPPNRHAELRYFPLSEADLKVLTP